MVEKFEVGKSYINKHDNRFCRSAPFTVVYAGEFKAFVQSDDGPEFAIPHGDRMWHDEYHEPKVEKFERFVTRYENSAVTVTSTPSDQYGWKILGKIEITLKDGKLSSVKIVE